MDKALDTVIQENQEALRKRKVMKRIIELRSSLGKLREADFGHGKSALRYWFPLIVWISGIFLVSALPSHFFHRSRVMGSFSLHVTAFFVLFFLFYQFFRINNGKQRAAGVLLASFSLTILISFSKECWQLLFATRFFGLNDLLIDGGAAILGMLAVCIVSVCSLPKKLKKPNKPPNPINQTNRPDGTDRIDGIDRTDQLIDFHF